MAKRQPPPVIRRLAFLSLLLFGAAEASAEEKSELYCSEVPSTEQSYRLLRYTNKDGALVANWGRILESGRIASCAYINGHAIALAKLNLWADKESVIGKNVLVYHGFGDHCSQGKLLVFNERGANAAILDVHTLSISKFYCQR